MKSNMAGAFVHGVPMIGYAKASEVISSTLITILILGFYMAHYFWSTGFFTSAFTAYWFYRVYPLDFAHVADVVPTQLQFLLTWIENGIGRIIVAIVLVAAIIALAVDGVRLTWRISELQYRK